MATFMRRGGRKPLAIGKVELSYGMRADVNNAAYGMQVSVSVSDGPRYSLHLTNDEIDKIVQARDCFRSEGE